MTGTRRIVRALGTVLALAGLGLIGWAFVVWQWQDPVTTIYTQIEQRKLARDYEERIASAGTAATAAEPATGLGEIAGAARRYRESLEVGQALGRLAIPALGLDMVIVDGTDPATLKKGPGRHRKTYVPGEGELVYIAGHRTTYSAPFARIDTLRAGDRVIVDVPYGRFEYRVTHHRIVPADELGVLRSQGREVLALQACHPRFFASHRYIAYASPVSVTPVGGRAVALPYP